MWLWSASRQDVRLFTYLLPYLPTCLLAYLLSCLLTCLLIYLLTQFLLACFLLLAYFVYLLTWQLGSIYYFSCSWVAGWVWKVKLVLSQPNLAEVGVGAELGNMLMLSFAYPITHPKLQLQFYLFKCQPKGGQPLSKCCRFQNYLNLIHWLRFNH